MFGKRINLFSLLGFKVRVDISWLVIAVLITWSLAQGLFPHYYKDLSGIVYWWMGIFGTLGLFVSVVVHEFSHSIIARKFGLPMKGITLFIFGGVAEMEDEPPSAKAEFFMAIAGPAASIFMGILFHVIHIIFEEKGMSTAITGILSYLGWINFILAGFNLLPAFPLDGGRVLRSILWNWKENLRWATNISSKIGSFFGFLLIFLGIFNIVTGNVIGGIWWTLIGMFLKSASQMSYKRLLTRQALQGEAVSKFMRTDIVTVSKSVTIREMVEDYVYRYHFKMFPVVEHGKLLGCVTTHDVKEVPKDEWKRKKVKDILRSCSSENTISPDTDAVKVLSLMKRSENSRLMVVENDQLVGIITLKDLLNFLSVKLDLEDENIPNIRG